ncbi:helix-turn-helix transcriptional regulator [Pontibacter chitinilyticus]|uniref:helix-turn-helix transcriptional regulator n=1 Tax=Pontibacter chitinilyticus TaxID=2674989 RepID=UPI00321B83CA
MIERIRELMQYKNLSSTQFADEVEVPRAVLSHILSGRNNPSLDVMLKIVSTFRDVSMNWLLLGEGEMLNTLASSEVPKPAPQQPATVTATPPISEQATAFSPGNVQENKQQHKPATPKTMAKEVEQIIIFYTDKTFTIYLP